jgi:hypothetical protein
MSGRRAALGLPSSDVLDSSPLLHTAGLGTLARRAVLDDVLASLRRTGTNWRAGPARPVAKRPTVAAALQHRKSAIRSRAERLA